MIVHYFCSTTTDGTMRSVNGDHETARHNREAYVAKKGLNPRNATLHTLSYDGDDYCRYIVLDESLKGDGILRESTVNADAVVVTQPNHSILLPLADCVGAVIHDPKEHVLMISHLGRHNLEQYGGTKCVEFLKNKFGSNPNNLTVWLSPSAGKENYPLYTFDGRSLQDVAIEQLTVAGVARKHIKTSSIDTTTNANYFSHSEYLKGSRDYDGRFAIVASLG